MAKNFSYNATSTGVVVPTIETPPEVDNSSAPNLEADVDDPAIYVNQNDPSKSIVITTLKKAGLVVYNLDGEEIQRIRPEDSRYNNVDIVYDFQLGNNKVDLAVVSDRAKDTLVVYGIDKNTGELTDITAPSLSAESASIFGIDDGSRTAYGLATYNSVIDGKSYVFTTQLNGNKIAQLELVDDGAGGVDAKVVRTLDVPRNAITSEGLVIDRERGILYAAQEDYGIYKFSAEVNGSTTPTVVDTVNGGSGQLQDDIEGLTMYYGRDGKGYLIASSQGDSTYAVYDREGNNDYLGSFVIGDGNGIDGTQNTDGLDIISSDLGGLFPEGVLVAQDGSNDNGTTNLKFIDLRELASSTDFFNLDTNQFDPRNPQSIPTDPNPDPNPPDPNNLQVTFKQGVNGYTGTVDTMLQEALPTANDSNATSLNVDNLDNGGAVQGLIRFDDIFGNQTGQIADNAEIKSARLELAVTNPGDSLEFYQMVQDWSDTATWNSLGNGIQANGTEAASTPEAVTAPVDTGILSVDVTESIKAWQNDPSSNYGWAILPTDANGVDFDSSEGATKPRLVVEYKENTPTEPSKTELAWEDQGLVDEAAVATGSSFDFGGGLTATVNWEINTNGGNFVAAGGDDFVSYESRQKGGDTGYLNLGFDNDARDPNDSIDVSLQFSQAVTGLSFSVLDVDSTSFMDDAVEIYADGVNILDNPDITYSLGGNDVKLDNETYMKGFEGRGSARRASTSGNIQVELGSASVSEITISYFSTDDNPSNPNDQSIGISDLSWSSSS